MKRKITFFTTVPGVEDVYPIIRASEYKPGWISHARESYFKRKEEAESKGERFNHVYRCPGIFDIMNQGFIMTLPWDVQVETNGDGESFGWSIPSSDLSNILKSKVVDGHMAHLIADPIPKKIGALKSLVKFNSPWHVVAPPGVKLLIVPIPYPDEQIFEHATGILDPGYSTELNPQGYWRLLQGKHTLKAGTPVMQIIPLSEEEFNLEVKSADEKEIEWTKKRSYFFNLSFVFKRSLMKAQYFKHFFGKN
jgi:hypothetical protein